MRGLVRLTFVFALMLPAWVVRSDDWEEVWQRGGVGVVTWSHEGRCATLQISDEIVRLKALGKETGLYTGTYALLWQRLLIYAASPDCVKSGATPSNGRILGRDVRGRLDANGELAVTLMFGDCKGTDCPPAGISRHRLRLAGNEIYSDALLNGGLSRATFLRQSSRGQLLAQARSEAAPIAASIRQIDCAAMYDTFLPRLQAATTRSEWLQSCEKSAELVGRPEARRIVAEHIFAAGESGFALPTMLRISGVDTRHGNRVMEFMLVVREASGWKLAFIGWV